MQIKCVVFDLGGVIVDYTEQEYYRMLSKKYNIPYKKIFDTFEHLIELEESGSILQEDLERKARKLLNLHSDLMWVKAFTMFGKTDSNMVKLIRKMRKHYIICLLTNISRSRYSTATKYFINKEDFDIRFVSCYLKMRKPDMIIYKYIVKKIGLVASEILFVDNLPENLVNARKLGINCILFKNYNQLVYELKKYGVNINKLK